MSRPTTPARLIALSTPSTPSTAQHATSPQELTPRSKVKAMLAAIDDDSDQEPPLEHEGQTRIALSTVDANVQKVDEREQIVQDNDLDEERSEEEQEEESLFLPRGRLAARLGRQAAIREESSPNEKESPDENAYARIKEKLIFGDPKKLKDSAPCVEPTALDNWGEGAKAVIPSRPSTPNPDSDRMLSPLTSSARSRRPSPGLFLTPEGEPRTQSPNEKPANKDESDSDLPANPQSMQRILERAARKKAEREAKRAAEDEKRRKVARQKSFEKELSKDASSGSGISDEDRAADKRLTQLARPTRKASKKAIEEMSRETQRMSRNMQLAHQAKTKKKITKDSLFARFNFRTSVTPMAEASQHPSSSTIASSAPTSDLEEAQHMQSPPTSPIEPNDPAKKPVDTSLDKSTASVDTIVHAAEEDGEDLPNLLDIISQTAPKLDKGKGKAVNRSGVETASDPKTSKKTKFTQPPIRVRAPKLPLGAKTMELDSDSDLELVPVKMSRSSRPDVFDRLPVSKIQEGRSLQTLRALAHLASPGKQMRGKKATMSLADMQTSLQKRARQQAVEERAAKIEDLRSRGIIVQTAEERQQDQAEVEDLIEKARREGEEIMQKEKRAAKKAKTANGEVDDLPDTSDEDDDYREDQGAEPEVELSGSEDGEGDESEELDELASNAEESVNEDERGGVSLKDKSGRNGLVVDEASEDGDDEEEEGVEIDVATDNDEQPGEAQIRRSRRNKMVLDDDDDDDDGQEENTQIPVQPKTPAIEMSALPENPFTSHAVPMGMTQAFAATMADTQTQGDENAEEQDSMAMFDSVPEPNFPMFDINDSPDLVEDSQVGLQEPETNSSKELELHFSQSQIQYDALGDTQDQLMATQMSEIPDPTQDVGFASSPAPETRFVSEPPSTVDTVLLPGTADNGSPVKKKRGRLQRRAAVEAIPSNVDENLTIAPREGAQANVETNAFDAMRKARKAGKAAAAREAFDKKKSEANGMVEEQAQESEDEYAGLGGASDEDSGEEDEDVRAMMDHGEVNVDEGKLAGFYADKERASDEKAVAKLYKDINSGMLRKKRGADFDLSDSDDDAEARKRRKRIEFAKLRKAMLADEKVGKIAEDPKKLAFLQSIEDRNPDDDFDFLDLPAEDSFRVEMGTQEDPDSQSQQPALPAPQTGKRKRPLTDSVPDSGNMRPPPAARRTAAAKKPATLAEIRESVSFLIEEPGSINIAQEPSSSASEDEENRHDSSHYNSRRTPANPIIDRLSLKRAESASISTSSRLAFHDPAMNSAIGGFKVPSLLRRATTSQLNANGADANGISTAAMTERAAGGGEKGDFVRRGGTKRSSVNFVSRERERSGAVEGVERRRKEERERRSGLGTLGMGSFE